MLQILRETIQGWTFAFTAPKSGSVVSRDNVNALEREIRRVCKANPYPRETCLQRAKAIDMKDRFEEYVKLYEGIVHE